MRTPTPRQTIDTVVAIFEVVSGEEAILQAQVHLRRNRIANAGNHLPCKNRIAIVESGVNVVGFSVILDMGEAGTGADGRKLGSDEIEVLRAGLFAAASDL